MESQKFEFQIEDKSISVTEKEVTTFYGPHYNLAKEEMDSYARYVARIKYYDAYCKNLDKSLVLRLIEKEKQMKIGEVNGFKLQLEFSWFVELKRENYNGFKYTLEAYCLDHPQSFGRRYTTLEAALLYCLNRFNENANISNQYNSIEDFMK